MIRKILLFSCEPGGAEVLIPVIEYLQTHSDYCLTVLAYGYAMERFTRAGINYIEIESFEEEDSAYIERFKPDILITSATSIPEKDMSEKYLWRQAEKYKILSIAFLDQWQNYTIRFSGPNKTDRLGYLPTFINCIDEYARQEMMDEGFPEDTLIPLGQPYLSTIREKVAAINGIEIKQNLGMATDTQVALFVSEPISVVYGCSRGYDEYQSLIIFLDSVSSGSDPVRPVIKLHPKDEPAKYEEILQQYKDLMPLVLPARFHSLEILSISDYVIGMTSIMLIEAYILDIPVTSIQPGLKVTDPLVLSRHGLVKLFSQQKFFSLDDITKYEKVEMLGYKFNGGELLELLHERLY